MSCDFHFSKIITKPLVYIKIQKYIIKPFSPEIWRGINLSKPECFKQGVRVISLWHLEELYGRLITANSNCRVIKDPYLHKVLHFCYKYCYVQGVDSLQKISVQFTRLDWKMNQSQNYKQLQAVRLPPTLSNQHKVREREIHFKPVPNCSLPLLCWRVEVRESRRNI